MNEQHLPHTHTHTQHNQSNKPANKRIRLEFSRNNLRVRFFFQLFMFFDVFIDTTTKQKLATVPEDEKLIYPPPPNINPFYHHDDDDADDDVSTKIEQYENTKTNSLTHSKPMWCKTSSNQQNPSLRMMMSERQRLSRYHQDYQELGTIGSGSWFFGWLGSFFRIDQSQKMLYKKCLYVCGGRLIGLTRSEPNW